MRVKTGLEKVYGAFAASGQTEIVVEMVPNKSSTKQCQAQGLSTEPIRLRLIRVNLKSGTEVLVTNLLDERLYPAQIFKPLYHLRWGVEENYKRQKQRLEIENFSGKSVRSVRQDFFAKIVTLNITAIMISHSQTIADERTAARHHRYQINFAQALSKMKDMIVSLIQQTDIKEQLMRLLHYLAETVEAVREHRSYPRNVKTHKQIKFSNLAYKRCR